MIQVKVSLPVELVQALKDVAKRNHWSLSETIKKVIEKVVLC